MTRPNRNINDALTDVLQDIEQHGSVVVARGQEQREVLSALLQIDRPTERVLTLPGRNNNVFAQLAETLWVLAGRNDLAFLGQYLPRAVEFSDDGHTWRAAYGPRIRAWDHRVDQLREVRDRLTEDPNTKRAVLSIFDPGSDYGDTKDVPCNNWLQFLHRDGELHLNVTVRANDAIWGFSGINFFEWSVLHEILANSTGHRVGRLTWFVGTLHVYERHYDTARRILQNRGMKSLYEFGIPAQSIEVGLDGLDDDLQRVFTVEDHARAGRTALAAKATEEVQDPFLRSAAVMLRAYNAFLAELPTAKVTAIVDELSTGDLRIAAIEYLSRRWRDQDAFSLRAGERQFLKYYWALAEAHAALAA